MAGTEVGSLYYDLDIDDKNLKGSLKDADKSVKGFGDSFGDLGDKTQAGFRTISKGLAVVAVGLTAYAKVATDFTVDYIKDSKNLARTIGVSTEEASRLTSAFARMGLESERTTQIFGIFSKKITEATTSNKENQLAFEKLRIGIEQTKLKIVDTTKEIKTHGDRTGELTLKLKDLNNTLALQQNELQKNVNSFQKLGISTTDASGKQKDFKTILFEVADKFKAMPDGVDKTTIALELFGRSGKDMIKVLDLGSAGIASLEKEADRLGLTLTPTTIAAVEKLIESQKTLKQQTDALKIAVGTLTAPVLEKFNETVNKIIGGLIATDSPFRQTTARVLAFGGPIAGAGSGLAAFAGNLSSIGPKMGQFLIGLGVAGVIIAVVAGAVFLIVQHFGGLKQTLDALTPTLGFIWATIQNALGPALKLFADAVVRLWDALNPGLLEALKIVGIIIGGFVVAAILLLIGTLAAIALVMSQVINWFANFIGWLGNMGASVVNFVSSAIGWFGALPGRISAALGNIPGILRGTLNAAIGVLWSLYGAFVDAGWGLITAFANGIKNAFGRAVDAVKDGLSKIRNLLPHSDAKEGPLSDLTLSGKRFSQTFAKGITSGQREIYSAVEKSMATPFGSMTGGLQISNMQSGTLAGVGGGNTTRYGDTVVSIGEIHNEQDEAYVLRRLDRNTTLEGMGLSPVV